MQNDGVLYKMHETILRLSWHPRSEAAGVPAGRVGRAAATWLQRHDPLGEPREVGQSFGIRGHLGERGFAALTP